MTKKVNAEKKTIFLTLDQRLPFKEFFDLTDAARREHGEDFTVWFILPAEKENAHIHG